jgi:photosystem II stability/assembly factor-like uncharacterized protein
MKAINNKIFYKNFLIVISLLYASAYFLLACQKNNSTPSGTTLKPDTLSAGWQKIIIPGNKDLTDIVFKDNTTGYLSGIGTFKSIDGGITWNQISKRNFTNIAVTSANSYYVRASDTIWVKSNIDTLFTPVALQSPAYANDVQFLDNLNGFCISANGLFQTVDGGLSWQKIISNLPISYVLSTLFFQNINKGWVVSNFSILYNTSGLNNWAHCTISGKDANSLFNAISAEFNNVIYATTNFGEVLKSTDDGHSFSVIKKFSGILNTNCDIHFLNQTTGYVSPGNEIYKTIDGGNTWTRIVALGDAQFYEIHFTDISHGWACGTKGTVLIFQ